MQHIFTQAGLNNNEAKVYSVLLEKGGLSGAEVSALSALGRALTYKTLNSLIEKNLVYKENFKQSTLFFPENPQGIIEKIKKREKELRLAREQINFHFADFNKFAYSQHLKTKHYYGIAGIKQVLLDSFKNNLTKEIFSFVDLDAYLTHISTFHKENYRAKREKLKIKKNIIASHSQGFEAQKYLQEQSDLTKIKQKNLRAKNLKINIYNNKVAFINLSKHNPHALLIESKEIFMALRFMFLEQWEV